MRSHKNQNMNQESRSVGMVTGRRARGSHVGRLGWSLGGAPQTAKVHMLLHIPYGLKNTVVLSLRFFSLQKD